MSDTQPTQSGLPSAFEEILLKAYSDSPSDTTAVEGELAEGNLLGEDLSPDAVLEKAEAEAPEEAPVEAEAEVDGDEDKNPPLEDSPEFKRLGKKAQGRIRELVEVKKSQQERLSAIERQAAQREEQYRQYLQRAQYEQQVRDAQYQAQLEAYRAEVDRQRSEREDAALQERFKNDPVEKFKYEVLNEAEKRAQAHAAQRVAEIERQLQARDAQAQQAQRNAERKERFGRWDRQLKEAVPATVFANVEDKESVSRLQPQVENLLLAYAAAGAEEPAKAAKEFSQVIDQIVDLRMKSQAKAKGAVVAKNRGVPAASAKIAAGEALATSATPTKHQLGENGFGTLWEYRRAGSPPLRK